MKPAIVGEEAEAVDRPLGVKGGGARGRMGRGTWEIQQLKGETPETLAENK
jgi:hypothetical protein